MRLFVAAEPSEVVRRAAAEAGERLRRALAAKHLDRGVRWVPEENLHLTVWFLGEVPDARVPALLDRLGPASNVNAFTLGLSGLGAFPPAGAPRVFWMGVAEGGADLARLHDEVGARLAPLGFEEEARPYSAHLTLARIKEPAPPGARVLIRQLLRDLPADAGRCHVDALTVFRSRTSPRGAAYEALLRVPLS